jgi:formiminotetrahydrofolate cyclodeaminase
VASALAAATAAALVELTAGLAADRVEAGSTGAGGEAERLRSLAQEASTARDRLLAIADDDARTYSQVTRARNAGDHARALERASGPPLAVAEAAAEVAEAAEETARAGTWAFRADAVAAGELAAAAAAAGAEMVATNLAGAPDDPRLGRARESADRARRARDRATSPEAG